MPVQRVGLQTLLLPQFPYRLQFVHGMNITGPANGFFGLDQGIQGKNTDFKISQIEFFALGPDSIEVADPGDLTETVELAQVGSEVKILPSGITIFLEIQNQLLGCLTVDGVNSLQGHFQFF